MSLLPTMLSFTFSFCITFLVLLFFGSRKHARQNIIAAQARTLADFAWQMELRRKRMTIDEIFAADVRAEKLLEANLTPEQLTSWKTKGSFAIVGGDTGAAYSISRTGVRSDRGRLCLIPTFSVPLGDWLLALKVAFESNETWARKTAQ